MSKTDVHQKLNRASETTLRVKGRKPGKDVPNPIWFTHEGNTVYLLPNWGSDKEWYKNLLADSLLKVSLICNFY
jgi:hypothetical protein